MFCKHEMQLGKVLISGPKHILAVDNNNLENIYFIEHLTSFHKTLQSYGFSDNELGENEFYYNELISLHQNHWQQESILVRCVPPVSVSITSSCPAEKGEYQVTPIPSGIPPGIYNPPKYIPSRDQAYPMDGITDTCANITFQHLRWRAVTMPKSFLCIFLPVVSGIQCNSKARRFS